MQLSLESGEPVRSTIVYHIGNTITDVECNPDTKETKVILRDGSYLLIKIGNSSILKVQ